MNGGGRASKDKDIYFPRQMTSSHAHVHALVPHGRWRDAPPFLLTLSQFIQGDAEMGGKLLDKFSEVK